MPSFTRVGALLLAVLLAAAVALGSCSSGAKKGGAIGGAVGATAGAVIGHQSHSTGKGAATGAVIGATAGAIIGDYMERQKKDLEKVPGADVQRHGDRLVVTFENAILFDTDAYMLKAEAHKHLQEMADVLVRYADTDLVVKGHTDNIGSETYNQRLSERRAEAVREYLMAHAVEAKRLRAMGFGESMPAASNTSAEGRALNRRVEVQIAASSALRHRAEEKASGGAR